MKAPGFILQVEKTRHTKTESHTGPTVGTEQKAGAPSSLVGAFSCHPANYNLGVLLVARGLTKFLSSVYKCHFGRVLGGSGRITD